MPNRKINAGSLEASNLPSAAAKSMSSFWLRLSLRLGLAITLLSWAVATQSAKADHHQAELGKKAPEIELSDLEGKTVKLSSFKGKPVVLEWFNPECPFVKYAHNKGPLKDMAKRFEKQGVVWLAINSSAPKKQGHGVEKNKKAAKKFGMTHPILLDESGKVGKTYGAKSTPQLFVLDKGHDIVFMGALDNAPLGATEEKRYENYVENVLKKILKAESVKPQKKDSYGCSVKYAD